MSEGATPYTGLRTQGDFLTGGVWRLPVQVASGWRECAGDCPAPRSKDALKEASQMAGPVPKDALYKDPSQPIEARVEDLLARMTLDEKVAQLGSAWVFEIAPGGAVSEEQAASRLGKGIGQITRVAGASDGDARTIAKLTNTIQKYLVERTRLGIPAIVHEECCAGFMARGATVFPQIIGLASTWQPELAEMMAAAIRRQMRAVGAHQGLAPLLDVARDPRWGRVEETFGEDPYLVSQMGVAYIRGLQGDDLKEGVIATGKHFAAYGVPEGGMNWAPAHVGAREFREIYLVPFEAAIRRAGLASIMNGYHELDGVPAAASRELLTELLRGQWGFSGIVVSDYTAVETLVSYHRTATDKAEAAAQALQAGIDVELPTTDCYGKALREAVATGRVKMAVVDEAVRRVIRLKFVLGLFENPYVDEERATTSFDTAEDRALARRIAQQSVVLLKNDGALLPLSKELSSIAVIGPSAHSLRNLNGDYHYPAHIEVFNLMGRIIPGQAPFPLPQPPAGADPMEAESIMYARHFTRFVSVLDGIKAKVGPRTRVLYAKGCDVTGESTEGFAEAVEAARKAEVAVVVVGEKSGLTPDCTCGEFRDRAFLGLPGVQEELVRAVLSTGTPTVVVLINGRPLSISWLAEHVPAILEAWIPGEEGGSAVADALFGDVSPGGRLPITVPRSIGQVPLFYNHKPSGGRSQVLGDYVDLKAGPLFPFGHGLSYTTFAYANLSITPETVPPTGTVTVSFEVTNTGQRAGDEVVQLYLHDIVASVTRPVKELKGFKRITLQPGETKAVSFSVDVRQMAFYDREMNYIVEPGEIEVLVGASSEDIRLRGRFIISGQTTAVNEKVFSSQVEVR